MIYSTTPNVTANKNLELLAKSRTGLTSFKKLVFDTIKNNQGYVNQALETGTPLNKFFSVQRHLTPTQQGHGYLGKLEKQRQALENKTGGVELSNNRKTLSPLSFYRRAGKCNTKKGRTPPRFKRY